MGEAVVLVCDVCGKPAVETVTVRAGRVNRVKDLCQAHLDQLLAGSRTPRRGRRRQAASVASAPATRRRRPKGTAGSPGKRRGRPRRSSGNGPKPS
jgi:hypothetical protein